MTIDMMIKLMYTVKNCLPGNMQSSFYKWLVKNDPWGTVTFRELPRHGICSLSFPCIRQSNEDKPNGNRIYLKQAIQPN